MLWRFLAVAALAAIVPESLFAQSQNYAAVRGWDIEYNIDNASCTGFGPTNSDGTSLIVDWRWRNSTWAIILANRNWKLKKGQKIPARIFIDRDLLVSRRMAVIGRNTIVLPIKSKSEESGRAFKEISAGNQMRVFWSGGSVTPVSLYGTRAAFAKVSECADRISRFHQERQKPKQPEVAGFKFEYVSREQALVFVSNMFAKAKMTGFEILPEVKAHRSMVWFRLRDGSLGSFLAGRGNTSKADNYVNSVVARETGLCKGTFGSVVEKLPSTDGSVLRKVQTRCIIGQKRSATETTIIRKPDGLLIDLTSIRSEAVDLPSASPEGRPKDISGDLVNAALTVVK